MQSLVSLRIVLKNGEKSKVSCVWRIRKLSIQTYCILELCKDGQHSSRFLSASEISVNILLHFASTPSTPIDAQGFCWLMDVIFTCLHVGSLRHTKRSWGVWPLRRPRISEVINAKLPNARHAVVIDEPGASQALGSPADFPNVWKTFHWHETLSAKPKNKPSKIEVYWVQVYRRVYTPIWHYAQWPPDGWLMGWFIVGFTTFARTPLWYPGPISSPCFLLLRHHFDTSFVLLLLLHVLAQDRWAAIFESSSS